MEVLGRDREVRYGEETLQKPPAPELMPGMVDGLALGICYETLDQGWDAGRIGQATGVAPAQVENGHARLST